MKYFIVLSLVAWQLTVVSCILEKIRWRYYFTDIKSTSLTPDKMYSDLNVTRIRGIGNVMSGYIHFKEDVTDATLVEFRILKNIPGKNEFRGTPYAVPKQRFSDFMNLAYKPIMMDDLKECAPEAPQFKKFVAPLTKRYVAFHSCAVGESTSNLPGYMSEGVYKVIVTASGELDCKIELFTRVEHE